MPELPEVETTRRGIEPHILGKKVSNVIVRDRRLRWPVPANLKKKLVAQKIIAVDRRAKYILIYLEQGCVILHLGMTGNLRILRANTKPGKHDHVDIILDSGRCLRFCDPRRFGSLHWTKDDPLTHKLLAHLGPEPLGDGFTGEYLYNLSRKRIQSVKTFIMDSRIVVGVGNIYASESLFLAGIHPGRLAGKVSKKRYERLADGIKTVLQSAIKKGGTTLRDFVDEEGEPGYFRLELNVYDRTDEPCYTCNTPVKQIRLGQRSTFYCPACQC